MSLTEQPATAQTERPVLVTGGTGFIGRHLIAALQERGARVKALVRRPEGARVMELLGAEPVVGDLLDPATATRAVAGVRAVYHLAGRLFSPVFTPTDYERLHVDGTLALLKAGTTIGALDYFVMCSTTGVLGPTTAKPAREEDIGRPQNAYEETKAKAERLAIDLAQRTGLRLSIARPGLVYGPGDQHLVGWFKAIRRGYYRVIGRGRNQLHPIYIDDLTRGLLLMPPAASTEGRAYHLVGSRPVTMRELSDAIGVAVGRRVPRLHVPVPLALAAGAAFEALPMSRRTLPISRSRVRFMIQNRAYDGSRARRELGFVPKIELEEGLARTVRWYRQHGLI